MTTHREGEPLAVHQRRSFPMSLRRVSLLSGFAALALVLAGTAAPASATEYKRPHKPVFQLNKAPTTQTATSTATAKRGDALSSASNDNLVIQDNSTFGFGKSKQINKAPTHQTAT